MAARRSAAADAEPDFDDSPPRRPFRRFMVVVVAVLGWPLVLLALGTAVLRLIGVVSADWMALLLAILPLSMAPCYLVTLGAVVARRWVLACLALVMAAAHLFFVWQSLPPGAAIPAAARKAPMVKVLSLNTSSRTPDPDRFAAMLRRERPDVVVLVELSADSASRLANEPALKPYASRLVAQRPDALGAAGIYSRLPLTKTGALPDVPANMPVASVTVGNREIRVQAVHARPPIGGQLEQWRRDLGALRKQAAATEGPLVLAGDFNATRHHPEMREILATGQIDTRDVTGSGLNPTWPDGRKFLPRLMTLDHILGSADLTVLSTAQYDDLGGDHSALVATFALAATRQPAG